MRRNYRSNSRSHYRDNNGNQTIDTTENGIQAVEIAGNGIRAINTTENGMDTETNIPPNIDAEQSIEQDKENTLKNTVEKNTVEDSTIEDNSEFNIEENTEENTEDISEHCTIKDTVNSADNIVVNKEINTKINIVENEADSIKEIEKTSSDDVNRLYYEVREDCKKFNQNEYNNQNETKTDITERNIAEHDITESDITEPKITEDDMIETDMTEIIKKTTMEENLDMPMNEIKEQKEYSVKNEIQEEGFSDFDRDIIIINKERYEILASEHLYIFHPEYFGISPTWANDSNFQYKCIFELKDHQLYLKSFQVTSDRGYPVINNVKPEIVSSNQELETVQYINVNEPLEYSGAIMFANSLVKDYRIQYHLDMYNPLCFSYKFVGELIFEEGKLITSVNHNKAMRRIRRNIDLGLRSLDKKQDVKCIINFIKVSFIGDYQPQEKKKKRYRKENIKNNNIRNKEVHMLESSKKRYMDKIRQHFKMLGSK